MIQGISFHEDFLHKIYGGDKTQTRRKILPDNKSKCKYGKVGDLLFVKEKHYLLGDYILGIKNNYTHTFVPSEKMDADFPHQPLSKVYPDDKPRLSNKYYGCPPNKKEFPASEMLEKNARIFLVITKLRKERIQNISNHDIKAEGFEHKTDFIKWNKFYLRTPEYSWDENPLVWVITFERVQKPKKERPRLRRKY